VKHFISLVLLIAVAPVARAQTTPEAPAGSAETSPAKAIDRSQYNLFRPTPPAQMRDFAPDRPSLTDAPYTVDPGHFLLELGLFEYTYDHSEHGRFDGFAVGDTNVRLGVTNNAEIDLLFTVYSYSKTREQGANLKQSGFSDLTLRSKINFSGDDGGSFAIGLIPSITFPTGSDGVGDRGFAGGVGLPVQFALPANFQLTVETTMQTVHEPGGGSNLDYFNSICLTHPITKKLSTYIEFASDVSTAADIGWIGTIDTALVYQPVNNWQLDAGVNIGVTKAANALFTFVGAAWRY
jgi:Putative MetA-pathway of phenol degradation